MDWKGIGRWVLPNDESVLLDFYEYGLVIVFIKENKLC